MKNSIKWFVVPILLISLFCCASTLAEIVNSGTCGTGVSWELDSDGLLTISGNGAMSSHPWTASAVKQVIIESGVTSIGNYAFQNCSSLASITIPDGVTSIGNSAFSGCSSLASIEIPEGVTSIGNDAFYNCTSLASITIPDSVTSIGDYAFQNCSSLASIIIPDSVTSIGYGAFYNCSGLTAITIPDGVTSVSWNAFYNCPAVRYCSIGSDGAKALSKANNSFVDPRYPQLYFRYIYTDDAISDFAVVDADESITSVVIPVEVTSIGNSAFADCIRLQSVRLPAGLKTIEGSAFYGCRKLSTIDIPSSVETIGGYAFSRCSLLSCLTMHPGLKTIGRSAFSSCTSLTEVSVPSGVTGIGDLAFDIFKQGIKFYVPASVGEIGNQTFGSYAKIYCYDYSYAKAWAERNSVDYVLLDGTTFESAGGTVRLPKTMYAANDRETLVAADVFPRRSDAPLVWSSSEPSVAEITQDGVLVPKKNGTATITLTVSNTSAKAVVTVVTPVADFTIPEDIYVEAARPGQAPDPVFTPADATMDALWEIEDPVVADVTADGRITSHVIGSSGITLTDRITGLMKTATLHTARPVSSIRLEPASLALYPYEAVQLTAKVAADDLEFQNQMVSFSTSNSAVAAVDARGRVQAVGAGTALIRAASQSGVTAQCEVSVADAAILRLPSALREIGANAFASSAAEIIVLPGEIESVDADAFASLPNLRFIVVPEGISLDGNAFGGAEVRLIRPDGTPAE